MCSLQLLESRTLLSAGGSFDKKQAMDQFLQEFAQTYVAEHGQEPPLEFSPRQWVRIQSAIEDAGFKSDQTLAREAWRHNYEAVVAELKVKLVEREANCGPNRTEWHSTGTQKIQREMIDAEREHLFGKQNERPTWANKPVADPNAKASTGNNELMDKLNKQRDGTHYARNKPWGLSAMTVRCLHNKLLYRTLL